MTDDVDDNFRIEAAEQFGFSRLCSTDPVYLCTEAQLIAFAKACERKGLAEAHGLANRDAVHRRILDIDAELAPILEAQRTACPCGICHEACPDADGKPLCAEDLK